MKRGVDYTGLLDKASSGLVAATELREIAPLALSFPYEGGRSELATEIIERIGSSEKSSAASAANACESIFRARHEREHPPVFDRMKALFPLLRSTESRERMAAAGLLFGYEDYMKPGADMQELPKESKDWLLSSFDEPGDRDLKLKMLYQFPIRESIQPIIRRMSDLGGSQDAGDEMGLLGATLEQMIINEFPHRRRALDAVAAQAKSGEEGGAGRQLIHVLADAGYARVKGSVDALSVLRDAVASPETGNHTRRLILQGFTEAGDASISQALIDSLALDEVWGDYDYRRDFLYPGLMRFKPEAAVEPLLARLPQLAEAASRVGPATTIIEKQSPGDGDYLGPATKPTDTTIIANPESRGELEDCHSILTILWSMDSPEVRRRLLSMRNLADYAYVSDHPALKWVKQQSNK